MKRIVFILSAILMTTYVVKAQTQENTSIAKGLGLYVFPSKGQDKDQQELDEYKCNNRQTTRPPPPKKNN